MVSYCSLDQAITSGETIVSPLQPLSVDVDWFWRGCRHVSRLFWRRDGCTWRVSHCGCSIDRSEQRRCFICFVEMPSVTPQLSMLALHKVGARLDMWASNGCGLPHISSRRGQHHQDSSAVGTSGHSAHLPRWVAAMSVSLAASIGAICASTSVIISCLQWLSATARIHPSFLPCRFRLGLSPKCVQLVMMWFRSHVAAPHIQFLLSR